MAEVRHGGEYVRHVVLPTLRVALECLTDGCWRWGKRLAGYWKIGAIRLFGRRVTGSPAAGPNRGGCPAQLNAPACSGLPFLPLFTGQAEDGQALAAARYQDRPEIVLKDIWVLPDHTIHRLSDEENSPCREWCRHKAGQKLDRANPPAMLPAGVRIFRKALNPMSTLVKVQPKGQMTIPRRVRSAVGLVDGDLVEVRAVGKKIVITPQLVIDRTKFPTADDEYTPARRAAA